MSPNGRNTATKKKDGKIADKFKNACPPHKVKDLDALVKLHKGDEEKITATIQEWWEEPVTAEPEWEDVNRKGSKRAVHAASQRHGGGGGGFKGDRGAGGGGGRSGAYRSGGGGGRGFYGRGMGGGRGAGAERRGRDYGGGDRGGRQQRAPNAAPAPAGPAEKKQQAEDRSGIPAPVTNVPRPKGAWGQGPAPSALASASAAAAVTTSSSAAATVDKNEQQAPPEPEKPVDPGVVTAQDPTPAGLIDSSGNGKVEASTDQSKPAVTSPVPAVVPSAAASSGNVWATKGSAHLIEAEKPKPPPIPAPQPVAQRQPQPPSSVQEVKPKRGRAARGKQQQSQETPQSAQPVPAEPAEPEEEEVIEESEVSVVDTAVAPSVQETPETESAPVSVEEPVSAVSSSAPDALESVLPASVNGANVNADRWEPLSDAAAATQQQSPPSTVEVTQPSPVGPVSVVPVASVPDTSLAIGQEAVAPVDEPITSVEPVEEPPVPISTLPKAPAAPAAPVPTNVLNMGHWETGEGDESQSLDFGFGSFGPENDVASVDETTVSNSTNTVPVVDSVTKEASAPLAPAVEAAPPAPSASTTAQSSDAATTTTSTATATATTTDAAVAAATVSPARPPPGLSIGGGMPPMPANAVHLHELEEKFESANLSHKAEDASTSQVPDNGADSSLVDKKPITTTNLSAATQTGQVPASTSGPAEGITPIVPQGQNYAAGGYGMGMYSYNAANVAPGAANGFIGVPAAGPVLAGVVPQQQQQKPQQQSNVTGQQQQAGAAGQSGGPQPLQQQQHSQGGLYGAPATAGAPGADTSAAGTGATAGSAATGDNAANAAGAIPPGIPGAMPYNPAVFYGQQHYQMGQPHGGVGYGYGYGAQFGGAVQGGYAYQQVMAGQSGAYGQPYDDQPPQQHHSSHSSHHSGGSHQGGYQKNSHGGGGGYRGRNTHHNSHHSSHHTSHHTSHGSGGHQYQNQYNPQQLGGYGGQPYNMGYNVDHFSQRGGYGPGNVDHYGMGSGGGYTQSGIGHSSGSGFNQDSSDQPQQGKNKSKGGNNRGNSGGFGGGNPNMQQFQQQQVPPQQQGGQGQQQQQQPFGLQAGVSDAPGTAGGSGAGWSSNQNWGGPSWQGS